MPSIMDMLLPDSEMTSAHKLQIDDKESTSKTLKINEIIESTDLDSVVNFKVNSKLKAEFDRLCKIDHSSVSRELKRYMTAVVRAQKVN